MSLVARGATRVDLNDRFLRTDHRHAFREEISRRQFSPGRSWRDRNVCSYLTQRAGWMLAPSRPSIE